MAEEGTTGRGLLSSVLSATVGVVVGVPRLTIVLLGTLAAGAVVVTLVLLEFQTSFQRYDRDKNWVSCLPIVAGQPPVCARFNEDIQHPIFKVGPEQTQLFDGIGIPFSARTGRSRGQYEIVSISKGGQLPGKTNAGCNIIVRCEIPGSIS